AMTPVYQATSQLFVSVKSAGAAGDAYSGGLFVQQRVKSYVDVVDSPAVLEPVIEELGLDSTYIGLASQVSATTPPNTVLLNVSATDTSPAQAAKIANAVAASYANEIARLEGAKTTADGLPRLGSNQNQTPVQATVIKPAEVPTAAISPRTQLNVLLGALLGLLVGVGIAVLRFTLDTSVKSSEELEQSADSTTLGVVTFDPDAKTNPLVTLRGTPRAEAFRSIRTNLQYVDVDNPPRTVVITSSLPSEGKSTTACNLAIAVAQAGSKVLLLEADLRRPKVAEYLGVDGSRGLTDVLIAQATLDNTIIHWQRGLLDFLPAGAIPPNPSELLASHQMADLLAELAKRYDLVILDAPPLLPVTDAAILSTAADGAILVARHGTIKREQVADSADALRQVNARIFGTVLNFVPMRKRRKYGYGYEYGYGYGYEPKESGKDTGGAIEAPTTQKA
ncbi:MAG: polysaccharide biosynthesis tyrosine autokinase, partial [Actinobacteria bacterium]